MDGVSLVIVGLGLFAFPEIIDLLIKGRPIAEKAELGKGWLTGVRDTIRHKFIVLRCSIIGVVIGFIPGLGARLWTGSPTATSFRPARTGKISARATYAASLHRKAPTTPRRAGG